MEIGSKIYRYSDVLSTMTSQFDYLEVMALEDTDCDSLASLGVPISIHMRHEVFGINISDSRKLRENVRAVETAKRLADRFGSDVIVVHPGSIDSYSCTFQNSVNFLRRFCDERFFVENMPGDKFLCNTPRSTEILLEESGKKFCFDVNHAIEMTNREKVDYVHTLRSFFGLSPGYFHLGGQDERRTHLSFDESTINLQNILSFYPSDARITLEVSNDWGKTKKDLRLIGDMMGRAI